MATKPSGMARWCFWRTLAPSAAPAEPRLYRDSVATTRPRARWGRAVGAELHPGKRRVLCRAELGRHSRKQEGNVSVHLHPLTEFLLNLLKSDPHPLENLGVNNITSIGNVLQWIWTHTRARYAGIGCGGFQSFSEHEPVFSQP